MLQPLFRKCHLGWRRWFRSNPFLQMGTIILLWFLCQQTVLYFHIPIPGGVLGLFIVLLLLYTKVIHTRSLAKGSDWLLAEMLIFFIPAAPAVLNHPEFLGWIGLKLLAIVLVGTAIVMTGTAFIAEFCYQCIEKRFETAFTPEVLS